MIKPNKKYLLLEKPTAETPDALRRVGRAKMGVDFKEYAGCPKYIYDYDDINMDGYYDTGFDKNSAEFRGLTPDEINKRLEDRKEIIEYFKTEVSKTGKTEAEFLDTYSLELKHNTIIDTSDMSQRLKLYFAMRGNRITPEGEEGNEVVYGKSMYKLVDREEKENTKAKFAKMSHDVKHWLHKNLEKEETKKTVYDILTYLNWMKPLSKSEDYILSEMVEEKIKSVDALEKISRVINSVPEKELSLTTDIPTWIQKGIIKRKSNAFFYEELKIGETIKDCYIFLINEKELLNELYTK